MIRLFICSLFLLAMTPTRGQTTTGLVRDSVNQPVPFAVVKLLRTADSSLAQGTVASGNGTYIFAGVTDGLYRVQASEVGMKNALGPAYLPD